MKHLILLLSLCATSFANAAPGARNKIDPRFRTSITKACLMQMTTLPPDRLAKLKVSVRSFCDCVAGEHELDAIRYQRNATEGTAYLKTILSFYSTPTADDSTSIRAANHAASDNDETFGTKCNQM